ncbi:MAG: sigma-70 family RNA polymerase sigma factor [Clostridia bacterium]|nr:sigma-70 family RNA polymerase sigma factor [Clostridia bacterium]
MDKINTPNVTKHLEELSRAKNFVDAHERTLKEYIEEYENIEEYADDSNVALRKAVRDLQKKIDTEKTFYGEALLKYHSLRDTLLTLNVFLSDEEFKVFKYRCIENITFQDIASKLGFSERNIYRLHDSALQKLEQVSFLF